MLFCISNQLNHFCPLHLGVIACPWLTLYNDIQPVIYKHVSISCAIVGQTRLVGGVFLHYRICIQTDLDLDNTCIIWLCPPHPRGLLNWVIIFMLKHKRTQACYGLVFSHIGHNTQLGLHYQDRHLSPFTSKFCNICILFCRLKSERTWLWVFIIGNRHCQEWCIDVIASFSETLFWLMCRCNALRDDWLFDYYLWAVINITINTLGSGWAVYDLWRMWVKKNPPWDN